MPVGYTGLRKAKGWEKIGVLYNEHEREIPGDASTRRNLMVRVTAVQVLALSWAHGFIQLQARGEEWVVLSGNHCP